MWVGNWHLQLMCNQVELWYEWQGKLGDVADLRDLPQLTELMHKSDELIVKSSRGMKGRRASGKGQRSH